MEMSPKRVLVDKKKKKRQRDEDEEYIEEAEKKRRSREEERIRPKRSTVFSKKWAEEPVYKR